MKIGFTIYEDMNTQNYISSLTSEQVLTIINMFSIRKDISSCRRIVKLPESIIEQVYTDIHQVEDVIINTMNERSIIQTDPTIVYNTRPSNVVDLKAQVFFLIQRDFLLKVSGGYTQEVIDALEIQTDYITDKAIQWSKTDGSGDWTNYLSNFVE